MKYRNVNGILEVFNTDKEGELAWNPVDCPLSYDQRERSFGIVCGDHCAQFEHQKRIDTCSGDDIARNRENYGEIYTPPKAILHCCGRTINLEEA